MPQDRATLGAGLVFYDPSRTERNGEDTVHFRTWTWLSITLMFCAALLPLHNSSAQEIRKTLLQSAAKNTKYGRVHDLAVEDLPNHTLRVFEIHRTYPDNPPVINGKKLVEWWARGIADLVDGNGQATEYEVFIMGGGDKFFARATAVIQNSSGKISAFTAGQITGGTGELTGIGGFLRGSSNIDIKAGFNENRTEIEYWFHK
jgi:hypothetical protein